jgi:transketolase
MPCVEMFDAQDRAWRESVLPTAVTRRLAIEAGATQSWWRLVGSGGTVVGIDRFGASGKATDLFDHFGLSAAQITRALDSLLAS